ncbi:MAG: c-type cytochrome [Hyphomicrobiales bacterium]|nr:c-type cytochrome [Hyphomicrobiales bacterium]
MKTVKIAIFSLLAVAVACGAFIYSGVYGVAADDPHTKQVYWLLNIARERSVEARAASIEPPADLGDPKRLSVGAGLYAEMCAGCHLAPGMEKTEIAQGLYPAAPPLAQARKSVPGRDFWIIKHGIKMSGMAAWGKTHSDELVWNMVAFLRKLPYLSKSDYDALVRSAPADHDETMQADHGNGDGHDHQHE